MAITSCNQESARKASLAAQQQRDSLNQIIAQKDNEINDMMTTLSDIEEGFREITEAQNRVTLAKQGEGTNTTQRIKENFRSDYVIDFIIGKETEEIIAHKHHEYDEFGIGEDDDPKIWNPVIRQALLMGYLKKEVENYGILKVTSAGKKFLKAPQSFMIVKDAEFSD